MKNEERRMKNALRVLLNAAATNVGAPQCHHPPQCLSDSPLIAPKNLRPITPN
jgi:hypothetical protein